MRQSRWRTWLVLFVLLVMTLLAWRWLSLSLRRLEGIQFHSNGLSASHITLTTDGCNRLSIVRGQLSYENSSWTLTAERIHWQSCDSDSKSNTTTTEPVAFPQWLPDLRVYIAKLTIEEYPQVILQLRYDATEQQLNLWLTSQPAKLFAIWRRKDNHCSAMLNSNRAAFKIYGSCDLEHQTLDLHGTGTVEEIATILTAKAGDESIDLSATGHSPSGDTLRLIASANRSLSRADVKAYYSGLAGMWQNTYQLNTDKSGRLSGQLSLEGKMEGAGISARMAGHIAGTINQPAITLEQHSEAAIQTKAAGKITIRPSHAWQVIYNNEQLAISLPSHIQAESIDGSLELSGTISPSLIDVTGQLLAQFNQPQSSKGQLILPFTLSGTPGTPLAQIAEDSTVDLNDIFVEDLTITEAKLTLLQPINIQLSKLGHSDIQARVEVSGIDYQQHAIPKLTLISHINQLNTLQWSLLVDGESQDSELHLTGELSPDAAQLNYRLKADADSHLLPLPTDVALLSAELQTSGRASWSANEGIKLDGDASIEHLDASYQDIPIIGANSAFSYRINPSKLSVRGNASISQLNPGIELSDIAANFDLQVIDSQPDLQLTELTAKLLGGTFSTEKLSLPNQPTPTELTIQQLELTQLQALQQEPVVALDGKLDAKLPLAIENGKFSIEGGRVVNRTPLSIRLLPTPSTQAWLNSQPQLKQVGSYLENLSVSSLQADLNFSGAGELFLKTEINGINRELDNRSVRLNYQHTENIYQLLRSIRLSSEFEKRIEALINQAKNQ